MAARRGFSGTSYRAANWVYVGKTSGRRGAEREKGGGAKDIYLYPLCSEWRKILHAVPQAELGKRPRALYMFVNKNTKPLDKVPTQGYEMDNETGKTMAKKPLRVLIVEDSGDDIAIVIRELRKSYDPIFESVDTAEAMKQALQDKRWDLVISDHVLPCFDGPAALQVLQESGLDLPFILVSGKIGEETAVEMMRAGAHDCIMKNKLVRLTPAVERELREVEIRKERKRAGEELHHAYIELAQANQDLMESEKRLRYLSCQLLTAQEEERKKIARELHDSIGSTLTAIRLGVESALSEIRRNASSTAVKPLESLIPLIQYALEDARRIYMNLRPSILDDLGIVATLNWYCREYEKTHPSVKIIKEMAIKEEEVPEPLKIVIFRIAQEATNNIAKHSQADQIILRLTKTDSGIELTVQDNGKGFDPGGLNPGMKSHNGLGLISMKERTQLSGGSFSIDSVEGEGTTVRVAWGKY